MMKPYPEQKEHILEEQGRAIALWRDLVPRYDATLHASGPSTDDREDQVFYAVTVHPLGELGVDDMAGLVELGKQHGAGQVELDGGSLTFVLPGRA